jgi:heme exporter protein D
MNHWPYINAAYAVTLVSTVILLVVSWKAMVRNEAPSNEDGAKD